MGNNSSSQQAPGGSSDESLIAPSQMQVPVKAVEEDELRSEVEDFERCIVEKEEGCGGFRRDKGRGGWKSDMYEIYEDEDEVAIEVEARMEEKWIRRERKKRRREERKVMRGMGDKGGWSGDEGGVKDMQVARIAECVRKRPLVMDGGVEEVVEGKRRRVKRGGTSVRSVDPDGEGKSDEYVDHDLVIPQEFAKEGEHCQEEGERSEAEEEGGEQTADGIVNGAGAINANASDSHEREEDDKQLPLTPDPLYTQNEPRNGKLKKINRQKSRVVARLNSRTGGGGPYVLVPSTEQAYKDDQLPTPPYGSSLNGTGQGVVAEEDQTCAKPSRKRKKNRGKGKSNRDEVRSPSIEEAPRYERSKKRKHAQIENEAPNDEYQLADNEIVQSQTKRRKRGEDKDDASDSSDDNLKKSKRKLKRRKLYSDKTIPRLTFDDISDANLPTEGPFVKVEVDRLERFVRAYREQNDMTTHEVNVMIQDLSRLQDPALDEMWNELFDLLPHRRPLAVRRTCRRRFHNYLSRGKWTEEEDEELKKLYVVKPNKWKTIGEMLSRMPEDCRDRWRNYLSCGSKRNTDGWTEDEELSLSVAVQECVQALRKDAIRQAKERNLSPPDTENDEDFLNFNIVSEKMGHTRSRLQCSTHWRRMERRNARQQSTYNYPVTPRELEETSGKNRWRHEQAKMQCNSMELGDKYAILHQIANSGSLDECNIPWKCLHRDDPKWTVLARKEAFKRMKKLVDRQDTLRDTVKALLQHFESRYQAELDEYWDLSNGTAWAKHGEAVKVPIKSTRKTRKNQQARAQNSPTGRVKEAGDKALPSGDKVVESNDEEEQGLFLDDKSNDIVKLVHQSDNKLPDELTEEHSHVEATLDAELQARVQQWSREISGNPESEDGNGRAEHEASLDSDDGEEDEDEQLRQQSLSHDEGVSASSDGEMDEQPRGRRLFRHDVEEEAGDDEVRVGDVFEEEELSEATEKPRSYMQNAMAIEPSTDFDSHDGVKSSIEASSDFDSKDGVKSSIEYESEEMGNDDGEPEVKSDNEDSQDRFERSTRGTSINLGETEDDREVDSAELSSDDDDDDEPNAGSVEI